MSGLLRRLYCLVVEEVHQVQGKKAWLVDLLRIVFFAARKAWEDKFTQRAAALAFFTLVNLFPVGVLFLFFLGRSPVFKGYVTGIEGTLLDQMVASGARQVVEELFRSLSANLDVLGSGTSGMAAILVLVALGTSLLLLVERYLNDIWRVVTPRQNLLVRAAILWTALTLFPLLLAFSFALTARLSKAHLPPLVPSHVIPYLVTVVLFWGLYKVVPAVPVTWRASLLSAALAGLLFEVAKVALSAYIRSVVTQSVIGKVYGSLALVPIGMAWIYYSWLIVLGGAELAYVLQHLRAMHDAERRDWLLNRESAPLSATAALTLAAEVARPFLAGEPAAEEGALADRLRLPPGQARRWVDLLTEKGLVTRTADGRLVPAREPSAVALSDLAGLYCDRFLSPFAALSPSAASLAPGERERLLAALGGRSLADLACPVPHAPLGGTP